MSPERYAVRVMVTKNPVPLHGRRESAGAEPEASVTNDCTTPPSKQELPTWVIALIVFGLSFLPVVVIAIVMFVRGMQAAAR